MSAAPSLPKAVASSTTKTDYRSRFYPESRFGNFSDVDGSVRFHLRVQSLIRPDDVVLDIGCGRGCYGENLSDFRTSLRVYKGRVASVVGIDVDPAADANPFLDEFRLIDGKTWPVEDSSISLAISDWTLEHVEDPTAFFDECRRVLAPGGYLCLRTLNRLGYVGLFSSLIPNRLHTKVLRRVQPKRDSQDVFPTVYRCNTVGKLGKALRQQGFDACVYGHEAEPSYLGFSRISYAMGVLYQKVVPSRFGNTLYAFAQKL